jgi:hypothetical protein
MFTRPKYQIKNVLETNSDEGLTRQMSNMMDLGSGERTSDELEGKVSDKQGEYCVSKVNLGLILAQFDMSLTALSWPLLIGGQVLRNWSGSIHISLYHIDYNTSLCRLVYSWAATRTGLRGTNIVGLGNHTLVK